MEFAIIVLVCAIGLTVISYLFAQVTTAENVQMRSGPRWTYLIGVITSIASVGYIFGSLLIAPFLLSVIFLVPGLAISLSRLIQVKDNEIQVIQNVFFTQKTRDGSSLRLFCRGGLMPLLHGEVLREVLREETRKVVFQVANMETMDSTPVDIKVVFWIRPDFNFIQNMLKIDQDQSMWWTRVTEVAQAAITARASDLIKKTELKDAIKDKKIMSLGLTAERISGNFFFDQENQMGFKIDEIDFIDIDLTSDVRAAYEQITKSKAYGAAAKAMAEALGIDLDGLEGKEKTSMMKYLTSRVLASAGKVNINEFDFNSSSGEGPTEGQAYLAANQQKQPR